MPKRKQKKIGKIPEKYFSKNYMKLPLAKKIAVRRKMNKECRRINTEAENVSDGIKKLNEKLQDWRKFFKEEKLREAKQRLYELNSARRKLFGQCDEFKVFAKQYFKMFEPHEWITLPGIGGIESNALEMFMHKSLVLLREAERFSENARETIDGIEVLRRKYS
jgi:hypothetical protein